MRESAAFDKPWGIWGSALLTGSGWKEVVTLWVVLVVVVFVVVIMSSVGLCNLGCGEV